MSNNEQQPQIAAKTQQQRRSKRLIIVGGGMTKTRPKQTNANVDIQHQRSSSDNDNSTDQNNTLEHIKCDNSNNNDPDASTSSAAAAAAAEISTSTDQTIKQPKARVRMVRRSNEPAEEDRRLMKFIRLYPFLYDKADAAYGKKKTSTEAWEIISKGMKIPVFTCKERWRNIRAAFMRSIDYYKTTNGPNRSKQYYMNEELSFLKNCVDRQKQAGQNADNDTSSNDADSEHSKTYMLPVLTTISNNIKQQQQPKLTSLTSEIATTSNGQMVLQNNASTIVSVTTAPTLNCNGITASMLAQLQLPPPPPPPPPPPQPPAQSTQSTLTQITLPLPFQLPATSTPKSSSIEQNDCSATSIDVPNSNKRRRYYEYDEKSDTFKRVQLQNMFDGWSEHDPDAHFLKSLYLKMRNLSEDQSLRFQCKAINALREVQMPTANITQKITRASSSSTQNAGTNLRLDHLNEEQRSQVQRYVQQLANNTNNMSSQTNSMNGVSSDSSATPARRFDLSSMVMPLIIKDESIETGHMSN